MTLEKVQNKRRLEEKEEFSSASSSTSDESTPGSKVHVDIYADQNSVLEGSDHQEHVEPMHDQGLDYDSERSQSGTPLYSTGNSNSFSSSGNLTSNRRKAHIASEQKRRQSINEGFEELRRLLPNSGQSSDSKAVILRKAVNYIRSLQYELSHLRSVVVSNAQSSMAMSSSSRSTNRDYEKISPHDDDTNVLHTKSTAVPQHISERLPLPGYSADRRPSLPAKLRYHNILPPLRSVPLNDEHDEDDLASATSLSLLKHVPE